MQLALDSALLTPELHLLLLVNLKSVPYHEGGVVVQLSDYRHLSNTREDAQQGANPKNSHHHQIEATVTTSCAGLPFPHSYRMLLQPDRTGFAEPTNLKDLDVSVVCNGHHSSYLKEVYIHRLMLRR